MDIAYSLLSGRSWAITEQALQAQVELLRAAAPRLAGSSFSALPPPPGARRGGSVAVLPIRGTLRPHAEDDILALLFGLPSSTYESIAGEFRGLMADDSVKAIVLDIDSPGGQTAGVSELATEIQHTRGKKPIVAVANHLAASAAYDLAASADAIFATPSALVGSIGVYMVHEDISKRADEMGVKVTFISAGKYKTEGNRFEPLNDEAAAHMQAIVDEGYDRFVRDVSRGRGVSEATVRKSYGQGRVLTAKQAKSAGMIDGIYTLEQAIARAASMTPGRKPSAMEPDDGTQSEADPDETQADDEGVARWRRAQLQAQRALAGMEN